MISVFTLEEWKQWNSIVRSFRKYDTYWLSGYAKAFKIHGDGEPLLFYYDDGKTRGINVVMKRDVANDERFRGRIPEGRFFDLATPYGYGGWIIEGDETENLFSEYQDWMHRNGIICEFVRFHPMIRNHEQCSSFYDVVRLGEVVHMDLFSPETIWENIISKNRNVIRKAKKNDVKVYNGRFPEIFEKFRLIYNATMDKDEANAYYYFEEQFYASILEDLPYNSELFWAEKNGKVIAACIILAANGYLNYHLSGSLREYGSLAPTNLILYKVAMWGAANGYRTLYLGGGVGSGEDGLFKFKRAFYKGDLNRFYIGRKVFDQERYDELTALRTDITKEGFFPKYRG